MRISSQQAFNLGVQGLQKNYSEVIRTHQQISTGNRILTPADDPVASVRLMQLEQQQNLLGQYKDNMVAANNSLAQEESTLNSVNTVMQRVRDLAVEAGNGALSQADRQSIAAELREREDELLGLMNSKNARGEYLFSGFQGKTQPFIRSEDGSYQYMGDEGQRKLQIAGSLDVPISDNGKRIFENITNAARLEVDLAGVPDDSGLIVSGQPIVQDEIAFGGNSGFPASGIVIKFGDPEEGENPKSYKIYPANIDLDGLDEDELKELELHTGTMDDDDQRHDSLVFRGMVIHFDGAPKGGEVVRIGETDEQKQSALDTIRQLRMALEDNPDTPEGNRIIRDSVAAAITNIDHAMVSIDRTRGDIGARMNIIETALTDNEDVTLINQEVQAELREVDYPEALSRLSFQSLVLEAAQQSYVKISHLNLFNKL